MRKILASIFLTIGIAVQAQVFTKEAFDYANKSFSIGLIGGVVGAQDDMAYGALGVNITAYGLYADFMGWPKSHANDVEVEKWHDKSSMAAHVGYQLPVTKSFRIIPVVGYAKVEEGATDGSNWKVGSSGIVNDFEAEHKKDGVDYGAVLVLNIGKINLYAAGTRRTFFGGLGFNF